MAVVAGSFYKCLDPWKEGFDEVSISTCFEACISYAYASVYAVADNSTSVTCICSNDPGEDNYTDLSAKFSCNRPCPSDPTYTCGSRDYAYAFSTYTITVTEQVSASNVKTQTGSIVGGIVGFLAVVGVALYLAQRYGYIVLPSIRVKKRPFENLMHPGGQYREMLESSEDSELLFDGYVRPQTTPSAGRVKKLKMPFFHATRAGAQAPPLEHATDAQE